MFERILIAYDDSEPSRAGVELAARMAAQHRARLLIAHVVRPLREERAARDPRDEISEVTRRECEEWGRRLEDAVELARQAAAEASGREELDVELRLVLGAEAARILELVAEEGIDLLVAGTHGLGHVRQKLLGSVSQRFLEQAPVELLFVREHLPSDPPASVIVGCDGSEWSKRAIEYGEGLARSLGGPLVLTHVAGYPAPFSDSSFLSSKVRTALNEELHAHGEKVIGELRGLVSPDAEDVVEEVREGHVRAEMLEAAEERYPSIVVVGTRGARGFSGLLVGSVTRDLVDYSRSPVLVVRLPEGGKQQG